MNREGADTSFHCFECRAAIDFALKMYCRACDVFYDPAHLPTCSFFERHQHEDLVTTVKVTREGGHDCVRVWVRGALAGELTVSAGEGPALHTRLTTASEEVARRLAQAEARATAFEERARRLEGAIREIAATAKGLRYQAAVAGIRAAEQGEADDGGKGDA